MLQKLLTKLKSYILQNLQFIAIYLNIYMPVVVSFNFLDLSDNSVPLQIGAHGKPVVFLHPKDCGGVLIELEES